MKQIIKLKVNGIEREVMVEPWWSLARVLRDALSLTGTKIGCEVGDCGACTVLIDGRAVKSCIYLAVKARDKDIVTIEGLKGKDGQLHPLQQSFIDNFALQCGYCTPGMILAAKALLDENPSASEDEIKNYFGGNLCRCTGYVKIIDAVQAVQKK